jgi:hypothetical protein
MRMKIESEYNGIKHGELCSVWDLDESLALEAYFLGHRGDEAQCPFVVLFRGGGERSFRNAKPIKTEAEKFLEKWGGKKIWQEGMWRHSYYLVTSVMDHNRVYIKDQEGRHGHIVLRASDDWQLWESPVKLDTRRVAGWWAYRNDRSFFYQVVPSCDGETLLLDKVQFSEEHGLLKSLTFSQDTMKPLDQWQTLEQICGGES